MRRLLHGAVLRSRNLPGFSALYRGIYAGAVALSSRSLLALPGVGSIYLHRGLSREGWEPGVSDIDLLLVRPDGMDAGEGELLEPLGGRLSALRGTLPMLGDIWLGTGEEVQNYLRWGGLRAWEDAPHWKLLAGKGVAFPELEESALKRRWLDPWAWLFCGHMEICRRFFGGADDVPNKKDADIRKLYLDVRRYSDFIISMDETAEFPLTRAALKERTPEVFRMTRREIWLDSSIRLAEASRIVLPRVSSSERPVSFPSPENHSDSLDPMRGLLSAVKGARGVVSDPPYHAYLILSEGAARADYESAARAITEHRPSGVPLVLEPSAWALALQSSYLGGPLGWLDCGSGKSSMKGETIFKGWGACALGEPAKTIPLVTERLRWESAAESASWMALWWRYLWIAPGWSNRFVLYHLYTRALGLRLALAGEASGPFSDWELILARVSARFGEGRLLSRVRELLLGETPESLDSSSRSALAPGHLALLARLMAGLQGALTPR